MFEGACTHFATGSFSQVRRPRRGDRTARGGGQPHPKIDLRYGGATVSLMTDDVAGLTDRDIALAQQVARELGVSGEPSPVQTV